MQEEWKEEERSNKATRKPRDGQKDQGLRKIFIKKPLEHQKGEHHFK